MRIGGWAGQTPNPRRTPGRGSGSPIPSRRRAAAPASSPRGERGFALHAQGPTLRRAIGLRLTRRDAYRRVVETDTKPTTYTWTGLGFRYPVASTRGDLDVVARAGARLFRVLGITGDDAVLS